MCKYYPECNVTPSSTPGITSFLYSSIIAGGIFSAGSLSTQGMWCVCMGGQLGRIPSIPGYLVFRTLGMWCVCMGGQLGEDPEYPGILSILDTGYVVCMYGGTTWGGSRVSRDT